MLREGYTMSYSRCSAVIQYYRDVDVCTVTGEALLRRLPSGKKPLAVPFGV